MKYKKCCLVTELQLSEKAREDTKKYLEEQKVKKAVARAAQPPMTRNQCLVMASLAATIGGAFAIPRRGR